MLYPLLLFCIVPVTAANFCRRSNGHEVCRIGQKQLSYAAGNYWKCRKVCKYKKAACNRMCKKCKAMCTQKPAPPQPPPWRMPDKCKLEKDEGTGDKSIFQYYFSFNTKFNNNTCQILWYKGSGGNENRFKSIQECWRTCAPDKEPKGGHCGMKEDDNRYGPCTWHWGYRWNATGKYCQFFKDDGCFRTKGECIEKCKPKVVPPPPPPRLPKVTFYKLRKGKVKCCIERTKKCTTHTNRPKCRTQLLKKYKYIK
ncbi:unnamed protein product [Cylicocyclus nassatus]|uniref:BPTI/Kunitz inhibitor domain-containing protein n=1 Tax=Cylicocyclus nassatus TaxID=53992 RepID=A0AA36M0B7_CYLNA|nr:unnamed protein product [Cylicocyclus nassatus]